MNNKYENINKTLTDSKSHLAKSESELKTTNRK